MIVIRLLIGWLIRLEIRWWAGGDDDDGGGGDGGDGDGGDDDSIKKPNKNRTK